MGGCCCSSRNSHLMGTHVYYYRPHAFEDRGSASPNGVASAFAAGLLVDLGLETSIPDTFRAPAPLPFDKLLGHPQSTDSKSVRERTPGSSFDKLARSGDIEESECRTEPGSVLLSPKKSEVSKQNESKCVVAEELEACPICLEEYDEENPKLVTKCVHQFHLSCLLEWMERSDTCPICDKFLDGFTDYW